MRDQPDVLLRLYIAGRSPRSEAAIANLRRLRTRLDWLHIELRIVDVIENPEVAEAEQILITPLLLKQFPPPEHRMIGDLSDLSSLLDALGIPTEEGRFVRPAPTSISDSEEQPR